MQNNDTEKFYDTYGKNVSFEAEIPKETATPTFNAEETSSRISVMDSIKKYLAIIIFIALAVTFLFVGGIFVLGILALMLIGMLLRMIFGGSGRLSSSFFIVKK